MPPKYSDKNLKASGHPVSSERKPMTRAHDQAVVSRSEPECISVSQEQGESEGACAIISSDVATSVCTSTSPGQTHTLNWPSTASMLTNTEICSQDRHLLQSEDSGDEFSSAGETELKRRVSEAYVSRPSQPVYCWAPSTSHNAHLSLPNEILGHSPENKQSRDPCPHSTMRQRVSTWEQLHTCDGTERQADKDDLATSVAVAVNNLTSQNDKLTQTLSTLTSNMSQQNESFTNSLTTLTGVMRGMQDSCKGAEQSSRQTQPVSDPAHASIVDSIGRYAAAHPGPTHLNNGRGHMYSNNPPLWSQHANASWRDNNLKHISPTAPNNPSYRSNPVASNAWPNDQRFAHDYSTRVVEDPPIHYAEPARFERHQSRLGSGPPPIRQHAGNHSVRQTQSGSDYCEDGSDRHRTRPRRRSSRNRSPSLSSDDSEARGSSALLSQTSGQRTKRTSTSSYHPRLPLFTGQEPWRVYYNRFQDVASLEGWTETDRLRELLPRVQGQAGQFVYEQLGHNVRTNFRSLVHELKNRFRKVETARTFGARFSNRNQNAGERAEDYAAELKRLYDKAHSNRDVETRREDLLRRFLDGVIDDSARFQVEYVKEPRDIDDAVYEVVNFTETKRRPPTDPGDSRSRRPTRIIRDGSAEETNNGSREEDMIRGVGYQKYGTGRHQAYGGNSNNWYGSSGKFNRPRVPSSQPPVASGSDQAALLSQIHKMMTQLQQMQSNAVAWGCVEPSAYHTAKAERSHPVMPPQVTPATGGTVVQSPTNRAPQSQNGDQLN